MKNHPKVTILSFSPIHSDGRVLRQIEYLSRHFTIDIIGYGHLPSNLANRAQMISLPHSSHLAQRSRKILLFPLGKLHSQFYEAWYWNDPEYKTALEWLITSRPDIIHANDWESLPVAVRAAQATGARIVLDLHEYAPLMREDRVYWRTFYKPVTEYFLRKYLPYITASVTVNTTIARRYTLEYHIHPIVVMNAPSHTCRSHITPTNPQHIHLIHHGNAMRNRRLERMIETVSLCDERFKLHLMLIDRNKGYLKELRALAAQIAPQRVQFHQPVPPSKIVDTIAQFDMGIYLLQALNFNQMAALPNKFFDFITAGLAICIGPSQEMARITRQFELGVVANSFEPAHVASLLNALSAEEINQMKSRAVTACRQLNADIELGKLIDLYLSLLDAPR